jgi:hypothetical protein
MFKNSADQQSQQNANRNTAQANEKQSHGKTNRRREAEYHQRIHKRGAVLSTSAT